MRRDIDEQARQEGERRQRLGDRVTLGVALALTEVAVILLGRAAGLQAGRPALLTGLFWVVGVALVLVLGGVVLAGEALWEL